MSAGNEERLAITGRRAIPGPGSRLVRPYAMTPGPGATLVATPQRPPIRAFNPWRIPIAPGTHVVLHPVTIDGKRVNIITAAEC